MPDEYSEHPDETNETDDQPEDTTKEPNEVSDKPHIDSTHPDFDEATFHEYTDHIDQLIEETPPTTKDADRIEAMITPHDNSTPPEDTEPPSQDTQDEESTPPEQARSPEHGEIPQTDLIESDIQPPQPNNESPTEELANIFGELPEPNINDPQDLPTDAHSFSKSKHVPTIHHEHDNLEPNDKQACRSKEPQEPTLPVLEPNNPSDTPRPSFREWFQNPTEEIPIDPDSKTAIDEMLDRHPYIRDRDSFDKHYKDLQWYIVLKDAQHHNDLPITSNHNLARTLNLQPPVTRYWLQNERAPRLLESLIAHEQARCYHEAKLPHEHHNYRIATTTIYEAIRPLKDNPHTPDNLATAIETIYKKSEPTRFLVADLKTYHESGPRWTRTVTKSIEQHREEVENILNQRIPIDNLPHTRLRIGIHNQTLYLYHHRTNPADWLTLLKHEYFYFDSTDTKLYLLDQARRHLNTTDLGLSNLIQQVTDHPGQTKHPQGKIGDLTRTRPYLIGETLNVLLDASGRDFEDIHLFITRLGRDTQGDGRGGIHNPIFLKDEQRDLFFARITAIALSDGHIHHQSKQFTYIENEPERRQYVTTLMKQLGNVYITHEERTNTDRLNMPVTIGRLLEQLGVPAGDKHLSPHYRLPEVIREGSFSVKCAYLEEVIPEDGYFHTHHGPKFGIKRAQILDAGSKAENYQFHSKISDNCKTFIHEQGEKRTRTIRDEPPVEITVLVFGKIEQLEKHNDPKIREAASQLKQTILGNPCQLLKDEFEICQSLGIKMDEKIKEVHLHQSGRVSVMWEIITLKEEDALHWAGIAMPSSNPKRKRVKDWLNLRAS